LSSICLINLSSPRWNSLILRCRISLVLLEFSLDDIGSGGKEGKGDGVKDNESEGEGEVVRSLS